MTGLTAASFAPLAPAVSPQAPVAVTTTLRGNYVLLRAETLHLLLPQSDVQHVGFLEQSLHCPEPASGLLQADGSSDGHFYVAVDSTLRPSPALHGHRFLVTTLGIAPDLHWCWSDVQMLTDVALAVYELPTVLKAYYTPVAQYTLRNENMAFLSDAQRLLDYVFPTRSRTA